MERANIGIGILLSIIGLIVFAAPQASINVIVILLGICSVISGFYGLKKICPLSSDSQYHLTVLVRCWLSILIGLIAVFLPLLFFKAIESVIHVIIYIQAIYLLISSIAEFFMVYKLHQENTNCKALSGEAAGSFIAAVILFMLPAHIGIFLVRIFAVVLIILGAVYAFYTWKTKEIVIIPENVRDDTGESEPSEDENKQNS